MVHIKRKKRHKPSRPRMVQSTLHALWAGSLSHHGAGHCKDSLDRVQTQNIFTKTSQFKRTPACPTLGRNLANACASAGNSCCDLGGEQAARPLCWRRAACPHTASPESHKGLCTEGRGLPTCLSWTLRLQRSAGGEGGET